MMAFRKDAGALTGDPFLTMEVDPAFTVAHLRQLPAIEANALASRWTSMTHGGRLHVHEKCIARSGLHRDDRALRGFGTESVLTPLWDSHAFVDRGLGGSGGSS